jgi:hypothetical protein
LFLVVAVVAAAAAAGPAAAKDRVEATLTTAVPLDAEPGTKVRVGWKLMSVDDHARAHPFGASGVFVRLLSATQARAETAVAPARPYMNGHYAATVVVPEGGIGDIEVGIRAVTSGEGGTRHGEMLFAITNHPIPDASLRAAPPPPESTLARPEAGNPSTLLTLLIIALVLATAAAVVVTRSRFTPAKFRR